MALGFGNNAVYGFGEELVANPYGTAAASTRWLYVDAGGDNATQALNWIDSKAVGVLGVAFDMSFAGTKDAKGDFTFEVPYQGMERIFKHALGQSWFTALPYADTVTNRFTFDINDDLTNMLHGGSLSGIKALTMKMKRDVQTFVYTGCKINTLEFSMQKDQNLKCKVGFVGNTFFDEANSGTPSFQNQGFFNYYQGVLQYTSVAAGTVLVPIESWSLTLNNNLDMDRYLFSGQTRQEPVRHGKIEVTEKFVAEFNNTTSPNQSTLAMFQDFKNQKLGSMDMLFLGPTIPGSSSNKPYRLEFKSATNQNQARVRQFPAHVQNEGRIKVEIEVKHYRDAAETLPDINNSRRELRIVYENASLATDQ